MFQKFANITIIAGMAVFSLTQGQPSDPRMFQNNVRKPTPSEQAWAKKNIIDNPITVLPNEIAVERLNKNAQAKGFVQKSVAAANPVAAGQEIVVNNLVAQQPSASQSLAVSAASLPSSVDNSTFAFFPPIGDQGGIGSCVPFSITYYLQTHMNGLARGWTNNNKIFSAQWTHNLGGMSTVEGSFRILMEHGAPDITQFPYSQNEFIWPTDQAIWKDAINYRANAVGVIHGLDEDPDAFLRVKQLLLDGYVLTYGTSVGSWQLILTSNDPATSVDDALASQWVLQYVQPTYLGGHEMTIVGYNEDVWTDINSNGVVDAGEKGAFKVANSWGTTWANNGFVWVAYDALKAHSAVVNGPTFRTTAWYNNDVYWLQAKASYKPRMLALATVNTARRNEIQLSFGIGNTASTIPTYTLIPFTHNYNTSLNGGSIAYDGGTTAIDGGFAFDLSDLLEKNLIPANVTEKWYASITDNKTGNPAILKAFSILDQQGNNTTVTCPGLPKTVDVTTAMVNVPYARQQGPTNYPPMINAGLDKEIFLPSGAPITLTGSMLDDNLPAGNTVQTTWEKISGPGIVTFGSPSALTTTANVSLAGTYGIQLRANDGQIQSTDAMTLYASQTNTLGNITWNPGGPLRLNVKNGMAYIGEVISNQVGSVITNQTVFRIINATNPSTPLQVSSTNVSNWNLLDIKSEGNFTYFITDGFMYTFDVTNPASPILLSTYRPPNMFSTKTALVGKTLFAPSMLNEVNIINVTNPSNPVTIASVPVDTASNLIRCVAASGNYLFVGLEIFKIQIFDIANLAAPVFLKDMPLNGNVYDMLAKGNMLYILTDIGLYVYDMRSILTPVKTAFYPSNATKMQIKGNYAYLGSGNVMEMIDLTNKSSLALVSTSSPFLASQILSDISVEGGKIHFTSVAYATQVGAQNIGGFLVLNQAQPNTAPFVYAGAAQATASPATLAGMVEDDDLPTGSTLSLTWSKVSGPGTVTFSDATRKDAQASFSVNGNYVLRLTATDGQLQSFDNVNLVINGVSNSPPTVAATAAATPNPVTAKTTTLSVLGADDNGEANLIYTWATMGTPPAPVTFSINASNAAKNTVATFTNAGTYTFQVTLKDAQNATVTSLVNVTVTTVTDPNSKLTIASATASSVQTGTTYTANLAIDADQNSRWSSAATDNEWIVFDLGTPAILSKVVFKWEAAAGMDYKVQASNDPAFGGTPYELVHKILTTTCGARTDSMDVIATSTAYRYVRMLGVKRCSVYGYSLFDVRIYAGTSTVNNPPTIVTAASANPNPVNGLTTNLSAVGADDNGEANLTYNWATTGTPPAAVNFSVNATNAAKNTVATFTKAGAYAFQVTVKDAQNATITSIVNVTVAQTLTSITIAPTTASVSITKTQQFTATAKDQFATVFVTQPVFTWSVSGGGSISTGGLFTAGTVAGGPHTITAISGTKNATASVTVTATVTMAKLPIATATASSIEGGGAGLGPLMAIDNNNGTRWSSTASDPQWITFDLGSAKNISSVVFSWEAAAGKDYRVQASNDPAFGGTPLELSHYISTTCGVRTDSLTVSSGAAYRYVRMLGATRCTGYGYSIWEARIYGN